MSLSSNTRSTIWYSFIVLFLIVTCIGIGLYGRKIGCSIRVSIIISLLAVFAFICVVIVALVIQQLTHEVVLISGVTYFLPFLLCCTLLLSKYLKISAWDAADWISLAYLFGRGVNIIGCSLVGCCQGAPVKWGIYSAVLDTRVVPVQLIECILIFLIWAKMNRYFSTNINSNSGKCAAICITLFGALNVITDLFTVIQPKIIYMTSVEGIFAFITMSIGLVALYFLSDKKDSAIWRKKSHNS